MSGPGVPFGTETDAPSWSSRSLFAFLVRDGKPPPHINAPFRYVLDAGEWAEELSRREWLEDVRARLGLVTIDGGLPREPRPMPEWVKDVVVALAADRYLQLEALNAAIEAEYLAWVEWKMERMAEEFTGLLPVDLREAGMRWEWAPSADNRAAS